MITVSEIVGELIHRSPFISEALSEGLINVSSLARKLQPDVESSLKKDIKLGAIVMAINRLNPGDVFFVEKDLKAFFRKLGDITVRSNLLDYTFDNSESLITNQAELLSYISQKRQIFYTVSRGMFETTIIISDSIEKRMEEIFKKESIINKKKNLSSITLMLPLENTRVYGIYYYILKDLAWHGINLVEVISTSNEFTLVVNDDDVDKAFSILMQLKKI